MKCPDFRKTKNKNKQLHSIQWKCIWGHEFFVLGPENSSELARYHTADDLASQGASSTQESLWHGLSQWETTLHGNVVSHWPTPYPEWLIPGYGLSQWKTTLHGNVVSHWPIPYPEWFLQPCNICKLLCYSASQEICISLLWRHNGRGSVSNHQLHDCLLNRLFRRRSKKTPKLRVTSLCAGNSPGTGEFPAQMASNAENVSIWWRHHVMTASLCLLSIISIATVTSLVLRQLHDYRNASEVTLKNMGAW